MAKNIIGENKRINQLTLLPDPPLKVTYPNPKTNYWTCLLRLLNGETITHVDTINQDFDWRLAASINKLKQWGWPIGTYRRPIRISNTKSKNISHYFLPQKIIEAALSLRSDIKATLARNDLN